MVVCDLFLILVSADTDEDVAVATVVDKSLIVMIVKCKKSLPYLSISILKVQKGLNTHIKIHVIKISTYFPRNFNNLPIPRKE